MRDGDGDTEITTEPLQHLNPSCWEEDKKGRRDCGKQMLGRIRLLALGVTSTYTLSRWYLPWEPGKLGNQGEAGRSEGSVSISGAFNYIL